MHNVFLVGYFGYSNFGDELMCQMSIKALKERYGNEISITVLSGNVDDTRNRYGISAISQLEFIKIISQIKNSDCTIFVGGSLFQDKTSLKSIIYYWLICLISKMFRTPYMLFFQGVGPIKRKISKYITKNAFKKAKSISIRDREAYSYISSFRKQNCIMTADMVFSIGRTYAKDNERVKKTIGFVLKEESGEFVGKMNVVMRKLKEDDEFNFVLFPFHKGQDAKMANSLAKEFDARVVFCDNMELVKDEFQSCDALVTVRYHGLILGLILDVPTVPISYDPKVSDLMNRLNIKGCVDIKTLDEDGLYETIKAATSRKKEYRKVLGENIDALCEISKEGMDFMLEEVEGVFRNEQKG